MSVSTGLIIQLKKTPLQAAGSFIWIANILRRDYLRRRRLAIPTKPRSASAPGAGIAATVKLNDAALPDASDALPLPIARLPTKLPQAQPSPHESCICTLYVPAARSRVPVIVPNMLEAVFDTYERLETPT